jgi:hypothetical protein
MLLLSRSNVVRVVNWTESRDDVTEHYGERWSMIPAEERGSGRKGLKRMV